MTTDRIDTVLKMIRVYYFRGAVAHLIDPERPLEPDEVEVRRVSLCGQRPLWPGEWFGPQADEFAAHAASLPLCKRCELTLGANLTQ